MQMIKWGLLSHVLLAGAGCSARSEEPTVERSTVGDTTVVRTVAGSRWGDSIRVVEELRVGVLEGAAELQFGRIEDFAAQPDGGFVIYEGTAPALRQFGPDGRYIRTLGRVGGGPGEYGDNAGLGVTHNGTILQYDVQNSRINRYAPDGTYLPAWPVHGQLYTGDAFVIDTSDAVAYKFLRTEPEGFEFDWDIAYQRVSAEGAVADTVEMPFAIERREVGRTNLHPVKYWNLSPLGYRIMGHSATYAITLLRPNGALRIERALPPTPWHPELRSQLHARFNHPRPGQAPGPTITLPEMMPAFAWFNSMRDGRLWVAVYDRTVAIPPDDVQRDANDPTAPVTTWRRLMAWDVFEEDGTFLGRVRLPGRATLSSAEGNTIWAIDRGDMDEQYVVRYRLVSDP